MKVKKIYIFWVMSVKIKCIPSGFGNWVSL